MECNFENCPNFERLGKEFADRISELEQENERLKETEKEISDFISDISTCGFRYDYRSPDNLDELQQCIEDLCNKFDNYKHTLQEIKDIAMGIMDDDIEESSAYSDARQIIDLITKAESEG